MDMNINVQLWSDIVSFVGIGLSFVCGGFGLLAAVPTLFSKTVIVRLTGCKFLSTAFLICILGIGMAGPMIGFERIHWLIYRSFVVMALLFSTISIYRLYKALKE